MDFNYDPLYPDHAVTDQTLHVWARHHAYCNKPAFIWIDDDEEAEEEASKEESNFMITRSSSTLSYSALDAAASAIAKHLHEEEGLQGIKPGYVLLVLYPPGLDFIKLLFGCLRANLCIAPLLPPPSLFTSSISILSPARLAPLLHVVKQLKPFAILAPSSCSPSYTEHLLSHESLKLLRWIFINHAQLDSLSIASTPDHTFSVASTLITDKQSSLSDSSSLIDKQDSLSDASSKEELISSYNNHILECSYSLSNHSRKVLFSLSAGDSLSEENIKGLYDDSRKLKNTLSDDSRKADYTLSNKLSDTQSSRDNSDKLIIGRELGTFFTDDKLSDNHSLISRNLHIYTDAFSDKLVNNQSSNASLLKSRRLDNYFAPIHKFNLYSAPNDKHKNRSPPLLINSRDFECGLSPPPLDKLFDKHSYGFDKGVYKGCNAKDVYLVQYTSGATGPPKPTLISAGAAAHNARAARKAYDLSPSSIIVSWLPQYHDCGLMFIHLSIITGTTSILTSPFTFAKNPLIWLHMLSYFKATCTPMPSFALPLVSRKLEFAISKGLPITPFDLSSLRNLILVNEPIEKDGVESFLARFMKHGLHQASIAPSYGLAENCTFVSTSWAKDDELEGSYPTYKGLLPSARKGKDGDDEIDIRVVHMDSCCEAAEGSEGEVWVASSSNAEGYLGLPKLTSQVFGAILKFPYACEHGLNKKCFVRTGDVGVSQGGFIYITGRVKDMLGWNGQRGHPHVIERLVQESAITSVRPGCVVAFSVEPSCAQVPCGCTVVVLAEMQEASMCKAPNEVLHTICQGIQRELTTSHSLFVGLLEPRTLPKTTSGKLQRWKAKKLFTQNLIHILSSTSHTLPSRL